jgi:hypothetical protein
LINIILEIIILSWVILAIFGGIIIHTIRIIFYLKKTNYIILYLVEAGFTELSNRFQEVVSTIGKIRPMGPSKEGNKHDSVWKEFKNIKFSKEFSILCKYQLIYKRIYYFAYIHLFIFIIPFIFIICSILYYLLF